MKTKLNALAVVLIVISFFALPNISFADWPFYTGNQLTNFTSPVIADIDGDGQLETVVVSRDGKLTCLNAAGSPIWTLTLLGPTGQTINPNISYPPKGSPTLADIDGNPQTLEIIYGTGNTGWGKLYIVSSAGVLLAHTQTSSPIISSVLVVDADLDGTKEAYFTTASAAFNEGPFYAFNLVNTNGVISIIEKWRKTALSYDDGISLVGSYSKDGPTAANLLGDEKLEILVALQSSDIGHITGITTACLDTDGNVQWINYDLAAGAAAGPTSPVVADLDNNGTLEIIERRTGALYVLNGIDGSLLWKKTGIMHNEQPRPAAVADLDGDNLKEIIVGTVQSNGASTSPKIVVLDHLGNIKWQYIANYYSSSVTSPSVADFDNDEMLEIVVGSYQKVIALNHDGSLQWLSATVKDASGPSSIAMADLDGDRMLELCFGGSPAHPTIFYETFNCLKSDGAQFQYTSQQDELPDLKPWPKTHQNERSTSFYQIPQPVTYTLTINHVGQTLDPAVTATPNQPTYEPDQVVMLTANAAPRWRFDHWSGDLTGNANPVNITMDGNKTVTAHFVPKIQPAGQVQVVEAN